MEQIREESVAKLSEIFQKRTIPLLNENEDPENRNRDNKKDMNDIINKITKLRIEQRVYKMKTNKQIDEELVKWKIEKIQSLRYRYAFLSILFWTEISFKVFEIFTF